MSLFVFVLMPFTKRLNDRYDRAIKQAAQDAGMRVQRVDEQSFHQQGITGRIMHQIEDADILVADMHNNNPNVLYEVGYAYAKRKLCILLTNAPKTIPFDLKDRRHVVFTSLIDLKHKLQNELDALKVEIAVSFDRADAECVRTVEVNRFQTTITGKTPATTIRARVRSGSELYRKDVSAQMIKLERRIGRGRWEQSKLEQPIQLTWVGSDTILTDLSPFDTKYANAFHINHDENKLSIWQFPMPEVLSKFLSEIAVYRVTVSVMGRLIQLDIDWRGDWQEIGVKLTKRRVRGHG